MFEYLNNVRSEDDFARVFDALMNDPDYLNLSTNGRQNLLANVYDQIDANDFINKNLDNLLAGNFPGKEIKSLNNPSRAPMKFDLSGSTKPKMSVDLGYNPRQRINPGSIYYQSNINPVKYSLEPLDLGGTVYSSSGFPTSAPTPVAPKAPKVTGSVSARDEVAGILNRVNKAKIPKTTIPSTPSKSMNYLGNIIGDASIGEIDEALVALGLGGKLPTSPDALESSQALYEFFNNTNDPRAVRAERGLKNRRLMLRKNYGASSPRPMTSGTGTPIIPDPGDLSSGLSSQPPMPRTPAPAPTPAATTIASNADDLAQLQTDRIMMNYLADNAKNADEGFDLMRWLAKSGDEINAGATKSLPLGKALGALGLAVDAGTTAYDVWHEDPLQSNEAKIAESLGAGLGSAGLGFWGGLKAGSMAGTAFGPVGTLLGGLAGGVIGSQAGKFLGKGIGELAVGGFDLDDGRKENIKKLKREAIEDQIEEMKMIAAAQQEIERENAIFNQALAQQALFEQTMMQMMMNGSMNTGNANAAQMIQAMYR
jgi:hypothetical protein